MNLLEMLLSSQNKGSIQELARNFGIGEDQAKAAIEQMAPALSRGLRNNASNDGGLDSLMRALEKGKHQRYIEEPTRLNRQETVDEGNSILGHIFGSKDVSRAVAKQAASQTGLASGLLKKMLPVIASMVMGSVGKSVLSGMLGGSQKASSSSGLGGMLMKFLDSDNDGSVLDDLLGMAGKLMR